MTRHHSRSWPRRGLAIGLTLLLGWLPFGPALDLAPPAQAAEARILGTVGRQFGWLNLESPRPQNLTNIPTPASAGEADARTATWPGVASIVGPFAGRTARGGDLVTLDLAAGATQPLLARADASESLTNPTWWPDGGGVLFQANDLSAPPIGAPGQEVSRNPARLEFVGADGRGRRLLTAAGREPAPAPDGSSVVFARTTNQGAAILAWAHADGSLRILVPEGRFADVAYPRYAPDGKQIAFVAPQSGAAAAPPALSLAAWLGPRTAYAHGIPWDPWVMNADGTGLRRVAVVEGDEPSVCWSPDGSQLFVYSGTGSFILDVASGSTTPLPYVKGYGPTAWV